jgi:hypothetical protein
MVRYSAAGTLATIQEHSARQEGRLARMKIGSIRIPAGNSTMTEIVVSKIAFSQDSSDAGQSMLLAPWALIAKSGRLV